MGKNGGDSRKKLSAPKSLGVVHDSKEGEPFFFSPAVDAWMQVVLKNLERFVRVGVHLEKLLPKKRRNRPMNHSSHFSLRSEGLGRVLHREHFEVDLEFVTVILKAHVSFLKVVDQRPRTANPFSVVHIDQGCLVEHGLSRGEILGEVWDLDVQQARSCPCQ